MTEKVKAVQFGCAPVGCSIGRFALQKPSLKISKRLAEGYASEEILKDAEKGHHDLIIMGSRGMGLVSSLLLGSVSSRVVNQAEIPVLIVK